ncbi:MAG: hypothetical protein BWY88_00516 [Synergistetes bacterium ADurb.Bin520]|nr:MAG: hypothetical protein BWY88_00516 [Synergistetes bacterium ADurb.Bin520]
MVSRATIPAAASTPDWRMPPPRALRQCRARSMKARLPQSMDPTGAPSPLERQNCTESTSVV